MLRGGLLTRFYLEDGICETAEYKALTDAEMLAFATRVSTLWSRLESFKKPSEAETEEDFIFPVLDTLGWLHLPQQEPGKGRRDVADALLFCDEDAKERARKLPPHARFAHGVVVAENEARDTILDRAVGKGEAPSSQIIRYLKRAETESSGSCRWGLLTNGRFWRLYDSRARARAEGFVEFELPALVGALRPPAPTGAPDDHWLRVFMLLFGRDAHQTRGAEGRTFLEDALEEGRRYEQRVNTALGDAIFERVFPDLVRAIAAHDPKADITDRAWREEAREGGLRLLYRLLFVLYAEDRELLPVRHHAYADYALRALRAEAADIVDKGKALPARRVTWWPKLTDLFRAISEGDASMALPAYNGGLFHDEPGDLLSRMALPDAVLARLLDEMGREGEAGARRWINYRDLSVQQLGSLYERLLERDVVEDGKGSVTLRANAFARKTSGSYYTPDELVHLILRRTVGVLLDERRAAFKAKAEALAKDRRAEKLRLADLLPLDPAMAFLDLRIIDIAMGSGHFLVNLVDYMADEVLAATGAATTQVTWAEYRSPLLDRIVAIRDEIKAQAKAHGWPVNDDQLDDRHLVRRIVLKRVVHGVDLNPMAVELAKLSLWLHSFTVGAPLSFLDHHLRSGDSLFGEFVGPWETDLEARYGLTLSPAVAAAQGAAKGMALVEQATDADLSEVEASARAYEGVEADTAALRAMLDLYHAARWLPAKDAAEEAGRAMLFGGAYGDLLRIATGEDEPKMPSEDAVAIRKAKAGPATTDRYADATPDLLGGGAAPTKKAKKAPAPKPEKAPIPAADAHAAACRFLNEARDLARERRFLHWEGAYPNVWSDWKMLRPRGGFHAVIGNPPWDRIKLQVVEWFAARVPEVAMKTKAAERNAAIAALRKAGDPIAAEFDKAAAVAETAARVLREIGAVSPLRVKGVRDPEPPKEHVAYPEMSGGDANLYALMVERAERLARSDGMVGLLVPSGIAADQSAAPFFRSVSTTGRLAALLDFENRRTSRKLDPFFPDVDSRFKFAAFVFGGQERKFDAAACAFFQQSATAAEANAFKLTPQDFSRVNPNTGTAPVFRSQRDADLVKGIYDRLPVLVDRSVTPTKTVFPVRYCTMLHMTNDSAKFRREADLTALGAYPVAHQRWEKGERRWHPLVTGRAFHQFDHRAASVVENEKNLHNPFVSKPTTDAEHADPDFIPAPQFWVEETDLNGWPTDLTWAVAFRDIARPTDARTVIAAAMPKAAFGNKAPLLLPDAAGTPGGLLEGGLFGPTYHDFGPLLLANLNAVVFDYVARQKVQGTNLNLFIMEQLPFVPWDSYDRAFGPKTARQIVRDDVLALSYTAHDMEPFARALGHGGPPFAWNEEDRLRRRARLDALFFLLYGIKRGDADYILGTFAIVREEEEKAFGGKFRSKNLIFAYMAALEAGAPDAKVAG